MITKKKRVVFIVLAVIAAAAIGLSIWGITVAYKKKYVVEKFIGRNDRV